MADDFLEYSFLSNCYENGISEEIVYGLFIEKVISDYVFERFPQYIPISDFQKHIMEKYRIDIPPTFIKSLIPKIAGYKEDFDLKKDRLLFLHTPTQLQNKYTNQQTMLDNDTRTIFIKFNSFLNNNNQAQIQYKEFSDSLSIYFSKITNVSSKEETEISKLLILWIERIYKDETLQDLHRILDKLMYSWLLFSYFYSVRRSKKRLINNTIVFDTNLLVYLLGVNGEERRFFVEYLIEKLKQNNCNIVVNDFSVKEFQSLLTSSKNPDIVLFRKSNPEIIRQIQYNAEEFLIGRISKQYNIPFSINSKIYLPDNEKLKDLISNLRNFKGTDNVSWESAEHDIKLIHSTGGLKKIGNIYEIKKLIATSDYCLTRWFSKYMKSKFTSDYVNLLTLDKMNLIFWIESDKCGKSGFLMNSWMSVSDSISYFNNQKIDRFFKSVEEKYNQKNIPPENWRSVYLLIKENLPNGKPDAELIEDDLTKALDKISSIDATENYELLQQVHEKDTELEKIRMELKQVKEVIEHEKKDQKPIVVELPEKKIDDFNVLELFLALLRKIFSWLLKK